MNERTRVSEAAEYIRSQSGEFNADIAIITGEGVLNYETVREIDYESIPNFPVSVVHGHKNKFILANIGGRNCYVLQGRIHRYEGYTPSDMVRGMRILAALGVKKIISNCSVGAINLEFEPGELMMVLDHINFTGDNPLMGQAATLFGDPQVSLTFCYNQELQQIIRDTALNIGIALNEGIILKMPGPNYETKAECKIARAMGVDAVAQSLVYECIAAAQLKISFAGICSITHMAAGIADYKMCHDSVIETCNTNLGFLIENVVPQL